MSFTLDPTTSIGKIRIIINDVTEASPDFTDEQITAILSLEDQNIKAAAATLLDTLASNMAMVLRKIELLDLKTDGPATAKALRDHADRLREQAFNDGEFDIVEQVDTVFGEREKLFKSWEREGA